MAILSGDHTFWTFKEFTYQRENTSDIVEVEVSEWDVSLLVDELVQRPGELSIKFYLL